MHVFSGGMFDKIPPIPHPMKGVALTSVDPAVLELAPEPVDITTVVRDAIKNSKKNSSPTYKQLHDEIYRKTAEKGKIIKLPNGTTITVDYEPKMYYNSSFVDPEIAKFLEQFP